MKQIHNGKSLKKRVVALVGGLMLLTSSALSIGVSALEYTWGPNDFTPYTGSFYASDTLVSASNMKWTEDQVEKNRAKQNADTLGIMGTEYEFRPVGYTTHEIWDEATNFYSNFPSAYYEFQDDDDDDIAVCCGSVSAFEADTAYYGNLYLSRKQAFGTDSVQYVFESEFGVKYFFYHDALPLYYEQYNVKNTYFGHRYFW